MGTSQNKKLFTDYEGFVEKFKPKKTTDDCYTPPEVYDAVLQWVRETFDIGSAEIVRPFYPGGDFENYDYPDGCVVVDNPPFSIFTHIMRWYIAHNIRFFLFAPHLSLASGSGIDTSFVICDTTVTYDNGAKVNTSFATNLAQDFRFWCCPDLAQRIKAAQKVSKERKTDNKKPCIRFPGCVTSSALLGKITSHNIDLKIMKDDCCSIKKCGDRPIFGGGFLLSDRAAQQYQEARRRADEERRRADEERSIAVPLSPEQIELQKQLG